MKLIELFLLAVIQLTALLSLTTSEDIKTITTYYRQGLTNIKFDIASPILKLKNCTVNIGKVTPLLLSYNIDILLNTITFTNIAFVLKFNLFISHSSLNITLNSKDQLMTYTFTQIQFTENDDKTYGVSLLELLPDSYRISYIDLEEFVLYREDFSMISKCIASSLLNAMRNAIGALVKYFPLSEGEFVFQEFLFKIFGKFEVSHVFQCDSLIDSERKIINYSFSSLNYEDVIKYEHLQIGLLNVSIGLDYTVATSKGAVLMLHAVILFERIEYEPGKMDITDRGSSHEQLRSLVKEKLINSAQRREQ